ncbi:MAG: energy transducer TonB [Gemmatimonadaceae bacterium]
MAGGTAFSIVLHTVLIAGAVYATAKAGTKDEKAKAEKIQFVEMKKEPPKEVPKEPPPPKEVVVKPPPPKGFQVLRAPVKIDIKIPEIDLSKAVTNEADFSGKGVKGGTGSGVVGGIANTNQTYFEFQVEKPAEMLQDSPKPKYPSVLESSGIAGEVQAQFVVNSSGKADMESFKVLKSTNELFTQAVKNVLPRMRFSPAMIGGKPVNQLVQQSFQFAVPR